jgi:geranylgeranyl pyrophosphate synthase
MLDEDPRGAYRVIGYGNAANLAVACQAASLILIEQAALDMGRRVAAGATLARGALLTAFGQYLDAQNLRGEESYWRVIRAKAGTMYAVGLQLGALFGKADPATAQGLYDFGVLLGEMMQIFDDLADALKLPADSDWFQGRNNLAILYADTAAHARREEFKALLTRVTDPDALAEAQHILISSGAVSYCVYQLVERYRAARRLLDQLDLVDHTPIAEVLALHADLWVRWLLATGAATSRDLNGLLA